MSAVEIFFDCKSYSTCKFGALEFTFYGIANNTTGAAMAFEMAYNMITEWAGKYKGIASKNSYCIGASDGLYKVARQKKEQEEIEARKAEADALEARVRKEQAERDAQLARLANLTEELPISEQAPGPTADVEDHTSIRPHTPDGGCCTPDLSDSVFAPDSEDEAPNSMRDKVIGLDDFGCFTGPDKEGFYDDSYDGDDDDENPEKTHSLFKPNITKEYNDVLNVHENLDDALKRLVKQEPPPTGDPHVGGLCSRPSSAPTASARSLPNTKNEQTVELEPEVRPLWASHMQLIKFREDATQIADDYLKEQGVKLGKQTTQRFSIRDWIAYDQGTKDSKKINLAQKRITEEQSGEP